MLFAFPGCAAIAFLAIGCGGDSGSSPVPGAVPGNPPAVANAPAESATQAGSGTDKAATKRQMVGDRDAGKASSGTVTPVTRQESSPFRFTDITKESGVDFVHQSGMT